MFNETDILILVSGLCGLGMVFGAFVLLYRGTIKLEPPDRNASPTELTISQIIKIRTNVASLVLFVLGFAFLWLGFSHTQAAPLEIRGRVLNVHPNEYVSVSVCGGPWILNVQNDGEFDDTIKPDLEHFQVQIGKVGVLPEKTFGLMKKTAGGELDKASAVFVVRNNLANLGEVPLEQAAPPPPMPIDKVTNAAIPKVNYEAQ